MMPSGSSSTECAGRQADTLQGFILARKPRTFLFRSRYSTSIVNFIKKLWTDSQGEIHSPSPGLSPVCFSRPVRRFSLVSATSADSAKTTPRVIFRTRNFKLPFITRSSYFGCITSSDSIGRHSGECSVPEERDRNPGGRNFHATVNLRGRSDCEGVKGVKQDVGGQTTAGRSSGPRQSSFSGVSSIFSSPAAFFSQYFLTQAAQLFPAAVSRPVKASPATSE